MRRELMIGFLMLALVAPGSAAGAGVDDPKPEKEKEEEPGEGALDRFEEEATGDEAEGKHRKRRKGDDDSDEVLVESLGGFFWELGKVSALSVVFGGISSWVRVHGAQDEEMTRSFPPREIGEPLIPFAAVEVGIQDVQSDVSAVQVRAEAGYGPFAVVYGTTRYSERSPDDELELTSILGVYRMSFSRYVEIDAGFGSTTLRGDSEISGFSMTFPLLIYPWENVGAEFRPAWSWIEERTISDYSVALVARYSVASVKAGYRWVSVGSAGLDGPTIGMSLHF